MQEYWKKNKNQIRPLDKRMVEIIQDGQVKGVAAFHKGWVENTEFICYYGHPDVNTPNEEIEVWVEMTEYFIEDLDWLLELPHHRFWSQIKYDVKLNQLLVSFLNHAPRYFDMDRLPDDSKMKKIIDVIFQKLFLVYLRLSTYKESKDCFISPNVFAEIIYEQFIFDIPKIMDLCVIYGLDNFKLLQKMISNIFSAQGSYFKDLHEASEAILNIFNKISEKVLGIEDADHRKPPLELLKQMEYAELEDVAVYIVDTCATLYHFLDIFPKGYECFNHEIYKPRIVQFYEHSVLAVVQELNFRMKSGEFSRIEKLLKRLSMSRFHLVKIYHQLLYSSYIQPLYDLVDASAHEQGMIADNLLDEFTSLLSDGRFLLDYHERFPIDDNLELIKQHSNNVDQTRIEYITSGIQMIQETHNTSHNFNPELGFDNLSMNNEDGVQSYSDSSDSENNMEGATASIIVNGVELDSLVSQVKDLLPDLGDGFVEACLDYYNYNPETVINCLLEESLPPVLQQLDRNSERSHSKPEEPASASSILESRANIYDYDEFDVFNKVEVDLARIHIGKKNSVQDLLDSKDEVSRASNIYQRYANVDAAGDEDDQMISLEYDDEYDDTYDSHLVGSTEPDTDLENSGRPFTTPRILQQAKNNQTKLEFAAIAQDEEDNMPEEPNKNHDNFAQDPALLREKAEQRRQSQMRNRGRGSYEHRGCGRGRSADVQGKPRGQGQDSETTKNRANKDKHKAVRGNHNRRVLAQKKQSRGMI